MDTANCAEGRDEERPRERRRTGKVNAPWLYRAFGLPLASEFPLPGMRPVDDRTEGRVWIRLVSRSDIDERWVGAKPGTHWRTVLSDACEYRGELGNDGSGRFTYADRAVFLLSSDARTVLCAPARVDDMAWQRVLLDSVLTAASVFSGFEALHASAVEGANGVVAFASHTGGGKSSVAAELIRRGGSFFCDDILVLERTAGEVLAHPGPPVMNFPLDRGPFAATEIGWPLATFGDEAWVAVRSAADRPRPLTAVCMLERGAGPALRLERLPASPLPLLPHAIGEALPPERLARRFRLFGDLATKVPVYRLRADLETGPAALADLLEDRLAEDGKEVEAPVA